MTPLAKLVGVIAIFGAGLDIDTSDLPAERDYGRTCLALIGFTEARDQDDAGLAMTMQTDINRATDPLGRWPRTLCDVALQPGQYVGIEQWPTPRHPERIDAASWQRALEMADRVIAGDAPIPAECAHATSFDQALLAHDDIRFACRLGAHTFYVEPPLSAAAN